MHALRLALLCGIGLLASQSRASAQGWGTIKGQAVCLDARALKPTICFGTTPPREGPNEGPILSEQYVVNPKNKGIRWVVAWLAKDDNGKADHDATLPIHPSLKALQGREVVMEVPCCRFEPHVVVLWKGQDFTVRISSRVPHNVNVQGRKGPQGARALLLPAKQEKYPTKTWKPDLLPRTVSCSIHPWMYGYAFCLAHPYFAVTDENGNFEIKNAPAGKYRLVVWHEGMGWVVGDKRPSKHGKLITIKAGQVTDVGKLAVKYDD